MSESVHLCDWPEADKKKINKDLEEKMDEVRYIVGLALAERVARGVKVKQPLALLKIKNIKSKIRNKDEFVGLIRDEVNIKKIVFDDKITGEVELDLNITEELQEEGFIRELIRQVQAERKEQNLVPSDRINVEISLPDKERKMVEKNKNSLLNEFRANEISIKNSQGLLLVIKKI
jgi:isoleucyl-tRNA synthetase